MGKKNQKNKGKQAESLENTEDPEVLKVTTKPLL
jgi:hypothetical protein